MGSASTCHRNASPRVAAFATNASHAWVGDADSAADSARGRMSPAQHVGKREIWEELGESAVELAERPIVRRGVRLEATHGVGLESPRGRRAGCRDASSDASSSDASSPSKRAPHRRCRSCVAPRRGRGFRSGLVPSRLRDALEQSPTHAFVDHPVECHDMRRGDAIRARRVPGLDEHRVHGNVQHRFDGCHRVPRRVVRRERAHPHDPRGGGVGPSHRLRPHRARARE